MRDQHSPVRLGIIGLGAMGGRILDVAAGHPDYAVARACDVSQDRLGELAVAHPGVSFSTDAADIVGADDLDAVYVATPPVSHAELTTAALASGKAVFCEKPLAVDLADGRRMRDAAAGGPPTAVNFALSDQFGTLEVERRLRAGDAGTVRGVEVRLSFAKWPRDFQAAATWLAGRAQGGFIREVFSHFAYLTDRLLGPLRVADVRVEYPAGPPDASEIAARGLLSAGDVPVQVTALAGVAGPELYEWTLWGTKESYQLRNWVELYVSDDGLWTRVDPPADSGSEASRLTLFAKAIRGETQPNLAGFEASYRVQEIVEAFHA
ncbi:MAG: Gfo/Idh/MocA family oxidoreductase [Kibdelosporangium sp.]